jgi:hypothetical protein
MSSWLGGSKAHRVRGHPAIIADGLRWALLIAWYRDVAAENQRRSLLGWAGIDFGSLLQVAAKPLTAERRLNFDASGARLVGGSESVTGGYRRLGSLPVGELFHFSGYVPASSHILGSVST